MSKAGALFTQIYFVFNIIKKNCPSYQYIINNSVKICKKTSTRRSRNIVSNQLYNMPFKNNVKCT